MNMLSNEDGYATDVYAVSLTFWWDFQSLGFVRVI
jgi:hypothetical protein